MQHMYFAVIDAHSLSFCEASDEDQHDHERFVNSSFKESNVCKVHLVIQSFNSFIYLYFLYFIKIYLVRF